MALPILPILLGLGLITLAFGAGVGPSAPAAPGQWIDSTTYQSSNGDRWSVTTRPIVSASWSNIEWVGTKMTQEPNGITKVRYTATKDQLAKAMDNAATDYAVT